MPHDDIPNMFGRGLVLFFHLHFYIKYIVRIQDNFSQHGILEFLYYCLVIILTNICHAVLSGTKYGLKQTRGKFGLGAKMVRMTLGF